MALHESSFRGRLDTVAEAASEPRQGDPVRIGGPELVGAHPEAGVSGPAGRRAADRAERLLAGRDVWRGLTCRGCGQRPETLAPLDAVAKARFLQRRCTSLLHHSELSLRHRGPRRGTWSTIEPAAQAAEVLGAAHLRLLELFGEEITEPDPVSVPATGSASEGPTSSAVLASFSDNVRRLTATIDGATAEDWYRSRLDDGANAGELVWLALHQATHHLEDAELVLDGA